jgi:hypothetical protein
LRPQPIRAGTSPPSRGRSTVMCACARVLSFALECPRKRLPEPERAAFSGHHRQERTSSLVAAVAVRRPTNR